MTVATTDTDGKVDLLKAKAMLLLRRERELFEFRLARDRVETWLEVFHVLSEMMGVTDGSAILTKCADMLIEHLGFEYVAVFRHVSGGDALEPVCVQPGDRTADEILVGDPGDDSLLVRANGTHESDGAADIGRIAHATDLEKFFWLTFPVGRESRHLLVAGFSPNSAAFHTLNANDEGHFVMFGNHLSALLSNSELVDEVHRERLDLLVANNELDASLQELRKTQEELVQSTRLASVGEMAGRLAHEVLNPITSIHGRVTRMLKGHADVYTENVNVFQEIVDGWVGAYNDVGMDGLLAALSEEVEDGTGATTTLLQDDLANLEALHTFFAQSADDNVEGLRFLLRETDRVTHIIDGTRSLTRQSGTPERFELAELLKESGEALHDGLAKRSIALTIDCPAELEVYVDRYEVIQVLTNLMRNSMLAIEEKEGRAGGTIGLHATPVDEMIEIRVVDSGTGISAEHLPVIFESHFTTRSSQNGTGLGLSICKRLVRGFGGELTVESTEIGAGSTFLMTMPAGLGKVQADGGKDAA